jgi:hypothetical protein
MSSKTRSPFTGELNEKLSYMFSSAKGGRQVTVTSRMGVDMARRAAMEYFWGPPTPGWPGNGTGLHLIEVRPSRTQ